MKPVLRTILVFLTILSVNTALKSQNAEPINTRYIEIKNIETFFIFSNNEYSDLVNFELYNIYKEESSKPVFTAVNELKNVHKFTIKSDSETYENQRTCFLSVNKDNHLATLRQVLLKMNVTHIKTEAGFIEIDKYFSQIL